MIKIITRQHPLYLQMLSLRQEVLRAPLGLNLYDEDLEAEQDQVILVSEVTQRVVACLLLQPIPPEGLKLRQMAVHPEYQGMYLGQQLLQAAEEFAKESGKKKIILHARSVAQGFYERAGYEITGTQFIEVGLPHYKMVKYL